MAEDNVIEGNFGKERWAQGPAFCSVCKYVWEAVAPVGILWLECPECGSERGLFRYHAEPAEGIERWVCDCGCDVFHLLQHRVSCAGCGTIQGEIVVGESY